MKRFVSLLVLVVCMATVMAQSQSYQMVIHVNDNMEGRFPEGKISIPVDKIREVTFEEISDIIIPDGKMPITFLFNDCTQKGRFLLCKFGYLTLRMMPSLMPVRRVIWRMLAP